MIYDSSKCGDGVWHCPFTPEWVMRMKRAATHCKILTEAQVVATLMMESAQYYEEPPGDFLSEPQDPRGLPLSWCEQEKHNYGHRPDCCTAIYDYDSIPEMVITNGHDDWPMVRKEKVLQA